MACASHGMLLAGVVVVAGLILPAPSRSETPPAPLAVEPPTGSGTLDASGAAAWPTGVADSGFGFGGSSGDFGQASASGRPILGESPAGLSTGPHVPLLLTGWAPASLGDTTPGSGAPSGIGTQPARAVTAVPEPSSARLLLLPGLIGLRRFLRRCDGARRPAQ